MGIIEIIIGLVAVGVAITGIAFSVFYARRSLYWARRSAEFARLAYDHQVRKPALNAFSRIEGDWPTATVTVTNTGDDHISIDSILLDVNGDGSSVKSPTIQHKSFDKFPCLLIRRAAIKFDYFARDIEAIPINVSTRIVLELSDGSRLTCEGCVLRNVE